MVTHIRRLLHRLSGEPGQILAEYTLILAFVLLSCVVAVGILGLMVTGLFDDAINSFP